MLYRFLRSLLSIAIHIYYKEIRIINESVIPKDGPVLLIANHPNTLMDAWMLGFVSKRRVYFMAKATFFNNPIKKRILSMIGLIPVNRASDSATKGVSNKDSFEACFQLLEKGQTLVIFPEGSSYLERKLRELKTGAARIALGAEARNKGHLNLTIVPVGINYIGANNFRGSVMVQVGQPIRINQLNINNFEENPKQEVTRLTDTFRTSLLQVLLTLDNIIVEELETEITRLLYSRYAEQNNIGSRLEFSKLIQRKLELIAVTTPWKMELIRDLSQQFNEVLRFYSISPEFLDRPFRPFLFIRQTIQSTIFILLTIPLFLIGFIHHIIPYQLIGWLVGKITKDIEYHAPLAVLLGIIIYPLNYFGWWILITMHLPYSLTKLTAYFILLPFSGMFAHFFVRYVSHMRSKGQFLRFALRSRSIHHQLKRQRIRLKELIFND